MKKSKKLVSLLLTLCMLLSVVPMMGISVSAETDPYASQGYVAYVVPHTLNADGTAADTTRPTSGTFKAYLYDATGEAFVESASTVDYDGLKVTESGETRYYYKSVDAAMAAAQAGETNTGYATSSNTNGAIIEGEGGGTYAGNDYLNPDLGNYTDTVVLLGDVDGYLYNYVRNQDQLKDWIEDGSVSAEEYYDLADTQKYGIHKGIIVDLNGHTVGGISGGIIPKDETLIIKNGTVSGSGTNIVGKSAYDDENWTGSLTGNVVFSGVTLSGNIFSGNHGFIFLDGQYNPNFSSGETAVGIYLYSGYYVNDPAKMGASVDFMNYHVQAKSDAEDAADWPEGYNYRILNGEYSYHVKLDANGVGNTVLKGGEAYTGETLIKTFETDITLPTGLTVQDQNDVTFLGWSSNKYATTASYTDTLSADIAQRDSATVTLYAIWSGLTHNHTWNYSAKGDTLTAACATEGCNYSGNNSLKISWDGSKAVLTGVDGNAATELAGQESLPTIHYDGTSGTTYSSTVAPTEDGIYMATVTVEDATAVCDFSIGQSVSYLCPVYKKTTGTFYEIASAGIEDEWRTAYCQDPIAINSGTTKLTAGWYIAKGQIQISTSAITVYGDVNIILADGCELTVGEENCDDGGIVVTGDNNSLTVYAQSTGSSMGKLIATGGYHCAGIGGSWGDGSNITINGGTVTATGGYDSAGIGGGYEGSGSNITINGGTVTATGGDCSAGIGGGRESSGSNITINGGTVTAMGGIGSAGIGGGGCEDSGSNITINGGTVTATGGESGAGIGGGYNGSGSNITINGGTVTATGSEYGAGIGGGEEGSGSNIKIGVDVTDLSGFVKVLAIGGTYASGIGCGAYAETDPSGIYVNTQLLTKADSSSNSPTSVITNDGSDLASALSGKQYALIDRGLGELTVSGTTVADKEYDGTTDAVATVGTVTGIADGDDVEVIATAEFASANAGTQDVTVSYTLSGKDADKYNAPAAETLSATITQKYLIIKVGSIEGYVGDALAKDEVFTFTADGLADGDTVTPVYSKDNISTATAGEYDICLESYKITDASDNDVKDNYCIICLNGAYNVYTTEANEVAYSASLTLNKNIDVNLKMKSFGANCDYKKIGVIVDGEEVEVTYDKENKTLSCVLKAVEPKDIGKQLSVTVTYDGKLAKAFTYSVVNYCNAVFNANTSGKYADLAAICEALLNYGKYAQDYYYEQKYGEGVFTSTLNEGHAIDFTDYSFGKITDSVVTGSAGGASLTLGSTIKLNYYVKTDKALENDDPETQNFFVLNGNLQINPNRVSVTPTTEYDCDYLVSIELYASQLSTQYTLKLKGTDTSKFCITYGVYNYCKNAQSKTEAEYTDTLKALCQAIHAYSEAVQAYIA